MASANNAGEKSEKWAQKKLAKQLAAAQDPASADTFGSSGDDPAAARNPDDPAPAPAIRPRSRAALDRMGPADREFVARAFPDMAQGAAAAAPPGYAPNYAPPNYAPPGYSAPSYPAPSYAAAAAPPSYGGRGAATAAYAPAPGYGAYGGGGAPAYSAPPAYGGGYGSAPAGYGGYGGGGSSGYAGYGDAALRCTRAIRRRRRVITRRHASPAGSTENPNDVSVRPSTAASSPAKAAWGSASSVTAAGAVLAGPVWADARPAPPASVRCGFLGVQAATVAPAGQLTPVPPSPQ